MDRPAAVTRQRHVARWVVGVVMVLYGVLGLALLGATALAVAGPLDEVGRVSASIENQRQGIIRALETTATTLGDAGAGLGRLDTSLSRAHDSTGQAAVLSRGVAATMRQLSAAMSVQILGAQPLIGVAGSFDQASAQLDALGTSIDTIGAALDADSSDLVLTKGDITDLQSRLQTMIETLRAGPSLSVPAATVDGIRLVLFGLMAWLAFLALAIAVAGVLIITGGRAART